VQEIVREVAPADAAFRLNQQQLHTLKGHRWGIIGAVVLANGSEVISYGRQEESLHVWDIRTGQKVVDPTRLELVTSAMRRQRSPN
jgi:hypothetical protein